MTFKQLLPTIAISAIVSIASVVVYGGFLQKDRPVKQLSASGQGKLVGYQEEGNGGGPVDFTQAASNAAPAVVHIKTRLAVRKVSNTQPKDDPFAQLFGQQQQSAPGQTGSGSGVILSEDGYIVTNQHVIADAGTITVTMANGRVYNATMVGADEKTDLAVLKIDARNLPFLLYGNSDAIKTGQWVLAIGYPWNLDITVTAGIVSAKTRSGGIDRADHADNAYIQTDAAINLGNSGGALVNTDGQLVGINAALASPTGVYAGYSYAIPVNVVKAAVNALLGGKGAQNTSPGPKTAIVGKTPA